MADLARKTETIRRIEQFKLSATLIGALEYPQQAESVAEAIECLTQISEQWH